MTITVSSSVDAALGLVTAIAENTPAVTKVQAVVNTGAQTFLNHNPELVAGFEGIEAVIAQYASELGAGVFSFVSALLPHIAAVPAATVTTAAPAAA